MDSVSKFIDDYMTNFGREPSYSDVVEFATKEIRADFSKIKESTKQIMQDHDDRTKLAMEFRELLIDIVKPQSIPDFETNIAKARKYAEDRNWLST